ncbi:MAG TPA: hypothetical protein VG389_19715, partial [Myxococcota bacterium]|nr:hypothetical protein [Myxococcota bacterium]
MRALVSRALVALAVCLAAGAVGCHGGDGLGPGTVAARRAGAPGGGDAGGGDEAMTAVPVLPGSKSIILRATHILLVRIESAREGEWRPRLEGGLVERNLDLALTLEEVLKGKVATAAGGRFETRVLQVAHPSGRVFPVPGVWSGVRASPGMRLVVFARNSGTAPGPLLEDPSCQRLVAPEKALADLRLA